MHMIRKEQMRAEANCAQPNSSMPSRRKSRSSFHAASPACRICDTASKKAPDIGAFLLASVLHFYSGRPLQNLSGVDTQMSGSFNYHNSFRG